jgi:hypothetical protein
MFRKQPGLLFSGRAVSVDGGSPHFTNTSHNRPVLLVISALPALLRIFSGFVSGLEPPLADYY